MLVCPRCSFYNANNKERCLKCGALLEAGEEEIPDLNIRSGPNWGRMFAGIRPLGAVLKEKFFPEPDRDVGHRGPFLAAGLSFIPGLGQFYNRQGALGWAHIAVFTALIAGGIHLIYNPISTWLFIFALLWINYSINQAFNAAQIINGITLFRLQGARNYMLFLFLWAFFMAVAQWVAMGIIVLGILVVMSSIAFQVDRRYAGTDGPERLRQTSKVWMIPAAFIVLNVILLATLPAFFFRPIITLRHIQQKMYWPIVDEGDRVLGEAFVFGLRGPRLGDVIFYDPGRWTMEIPRKDGSIMMIFNMPMNMERIIGLPGDTVERRDGAWFRNGVPAPPWEQPLSQSELWDDLILEVPEGHYAVLSSYTPEETGVLGTQKPMPLNYRYGIVDRNLWNEASLVKPSEMQGRVICTYGPARNRKWLTREKVREKALAEGRWIEVPLLDEAGNPLPDEDN